MNKKEPLPLDNTGTGKLGSIRVVTPRIRRKDKMEIEYRFHCGECGKPDKDFPELFGDYEYGQEIVNCPKVTEHMWARFDAYGIYTELCCDECYKNGNYSYKTDRYPTMEHDGYGERLEPEE